MLQDRQPGQCRDSQTIQAGGPGDAAAQIHDGQAEGQHPGAEENDAVETEPAEDRIQQHLAQPCAFQYGLPLHAGGIVYAERIRTRDRAAFQDVPAGGDMPPEIDIPHLDREIPEEREEQRRKRQVFKPTSFIHHTIEQEQAIIFKLLHHLHRGATRPAIRGVAGDDHGIALLGDVDEGIDESFGDFEVDGDEATFALVAPATS
jgi:hypothetical protein